MTEGTYEQLRDSATGEAGATWKAADREEHNLRSLYRELKEDPRYTNEHKAEKAWDHGHPIKAAKEKIKEEREENRAERHERF